jgi:hypothetical protein
MGDHQGVGVWLLCVRSHALAQYSGVKSEEWGDVGLDVVVLVNEDDVAVSSEAVPDRARSIIGADGCHARTSDRIPEAVAYRNGGGIR